MMSTE